MKAQKTITSKSASSETIDRETFEWFIKQLRLAIKNSYGVKGNERLVRRTSVLNKFDETVRIWKP